jgi:trans-4-hydroxy-L-proline dehydratase
VKQGSRRRQELRKSPGLPAGAGHKPRTFHEALQMYWFVHLGTITELNGWDAMTPGHSTSICSPSTRRIWPTAA